MDVFSWLGFPTKSKVLVRVSIPPRTYPGDPRKVAPEGLDEIDFNKRIAEWENLLDPLGRGQNSGCVNDN